jgi:hypothetical protein
MPEPTATATWAPNPGRGAYRSRPETMTAAVEGDAVTKAGTSGREEGAGRAGLAVSIAGLLGLPLAVAWVVADRTGVGPVLVVVAPGHGLHALDLTLVAAVPVWVRLAAWVWHRRPRRRP